MSLPADWTDEQIDLWLAEHLFKWQSTRISTNHPARMYGKLPVEEFGDSMERPTQTWIGMRVVIEQMAARGWWCVIKSPFEIGRNWVAGFTPLSCTGWNGRPDHRTTATTAPRAVAEAAVAALMAEEASKQGTR